MQVWSFVVFLALLLHLPLTCPHTCMARGQFSLPCPLYAFLLHHSTLSLISLLHLPSLTLSALSCVPRHPFSSLYLPFTSPSTGAGFSVKYFHPYSLCLFLSAPVYPFPHLALASSSPLMLTSLSHFSCSPCLSFPQRPFYYFPHLSCIAFPPFSFPFLSFYLFLFTFFFALPVPLSPLSSHNSTFSDQLFSLRAGELAVPI